MLAFFAGGKRDLLLRSEGTWPKKPSLQVSSGVLVSESARVGLWPRPEEWAKAKEKGWGWMRMSDMARTLCPWWALQVHFLSAIAPLCLALPLAESVGSAQPLVVLHAHLTSFAERQRGRTPALGLLPRLCRHESVLHQHTPRDQRRQPREARAPQGGPLCAGWELGLALPAFPPLPCPGNVWVSRMEKMVSLFGCFKCVHLVQSTSLFHESGFTVDHSYYLYTFVHFSLNHWEGL